MGGGAEWSDFVGIGYAIGGEGISIESMGCKLLLYSSHYYQRSERIQPFNNGYMWANTSQNMIIPNATGTELNVYVGGMTQQSTSGLTIAGEVLLSWLEGHVCLILRGGVDQGCYELEDGCFSTYGFEYKPGPHFPPLPVFEFFKKFFLQGSILRFAPPPLINHLFDNNIASELG